MGFGRFFLFVFSWLVGVFCSKWRLDFILSWDMSSDPPGRQGDPSISFSLECIFHWYSVLGPFNFLWRAPKSSCCFFLRFLYFLSSLPVSLAGLYSLFCEKAREKEEKTIFLQLMLGNQEGGDLICDWRERKERKKKKKRPLFISYRGTKCLFCLQGSLLHIWRISRHAPFQGRYW